MIRFECCQDISTVLASQSASQPAIKYELTVSEKLPTRSETKDKERERERERERDEESRQAHTNYQLSSNEGSSDENEAYMMAPLTWILTID